MPINPIQHLTDGVYLSNDENWQMIYGSDGKWNSYKRELNDMWELKPFFHTSFSTLSSLIIALEKYV